MTIETRILIRNRDVSDEQRLTYQLTRERRSLLEPGTRRRRAPQGLPPRVLQRPAHRLMVVIPGEVIAGVELQAMAIGDADIQKERVGDAMAAGTALDVLEEAAGSHHVAQMQYIHCGRHPVSKMVQARSLAVGDGEVVQIALPIRPSLRDAPL